MEHFIGIRVSTRSPHAIRSDMNPSEIRGVKTMLVRVGVPQGGNLNARGRDETSMNLEFVQHPNAARPREDRPRGTNRTQYDDNQGVLTGQRSTSTTSRGADRSRRDNIPKVQGKQSSNGISET